MLCMAGEWNVNKPGCARFALSKTEAFAVVSKEYVCCNPTCPRVEKKHEADSSKISKLCEYTKYGIQKSGQRHLSELVSLGASFYGHEPGVLNMLPHEVRSTRSRKHRIASIWPRPLTEFVSGTKAVPRPQLYLGPRRGRSRARSSP